MKRPPKRNLQAEVEAFNARVKIGDLIEYAEVKGEPTRQFRTQTAASILSGHTPVVWLACKSGCVDISHCLILPEQPAEERDVCSICQAEFSEAKTPGEFTYQCCKCGEDVCTECSENGEGNTVICHNCEES